MPPANTYRRIADRARKIPGKMGLYEYTVELLQIAYTGEHLGDGTLIDQSYPITVDGGYPPKVRFPTQREIALGMAGLGTCIVGPFTPSYGTGGVSRDLLSAAEQDDGTMLQFWIVGPNFPNGCAHRLSKFQVDKALQVVLELVQVEPSADGTILR